MILTFAGDLPLVMKFTAEAEVVSLPEVTLYEAIVFAKTNKSKTSDKQV